MEEKVDYKVTQQHSSPNKEAKFKIGDKVKVVEYGHLMFRYRCNFQKESEDSAKMNFISSKRMLFSEEATEEELVAIKGKEYPDNVYKEVDGILWIDINKELIGKEGIVANVINTQGILNYSLDGISGKMAWYNEGQLELISESEEVIMDRILKEWTKENKDKLKAALDRLLVTGEYKIDLND